MDFAIANRPIQHPTILTVPGIDNSGPDHWQTLWEGELPNCRRVDMANWFQPQRAVWVAQLERAISRTDGPVVLAAHSLGCMAVAWWSALRLNRFVHGHVAGALLVAPPDVEEEVACQRLLQFGPAPRAHLPFPTILAASRNDRYARFETSAMLARAWGSELVDAGEAGHLNAQSGLGRWPDGLALLQRLVDRAADGYAEVCADDRLTAGGAR